MKKLLVFIILVLLLILFRAPLLGAYAKLFTVNNATQGADAMIIMSGNIDTRPRYAAKLYHEGYANRVLLTREKNWEGFASPYVEARNNYAEYFMLKNEVPVEWLPSLHEEGAMSSLDEALDTVAFLKANPNVLHLILVTDAFHSYRVNYLFNKVLKDNGLAYIRLEVAAAPNDVFDESNWFQTELGLTEYFKETVKVPMYWLGLANTTMVVAR
jgi:uncharacterized SAM-binding protein YcdF (DUF218 family)